MLTPLMTSFRMLKLNKTVSSPVISLLGLKTKEKVKYTVKDIFDAAFGCGHYFEVARFNLPRFRQFRNNRVLLLFLKKEKQIIGRKPDTKKLEESFRTSSYATSNEVAKETVWNFSYINLRDFSLRNRVNWCMKSFTQLLPRLQVRNRVTWCTKW